MRFQTVSLLTLLFLLAAACGEPKPPAETQPAATAQPAADTQPAAATKPAAAAQPAATTQPAAAAQPAATTQPAASMDDAIKSLMAKAEHTDDSITVQHVLIAFQGAPRIQGVTRSKDEAKVLAEQVWKEALAGADFKALMKQHSNDSGPGEYPMTKAGRMQMVKGFGDVGFRLAVGEIGVAPWDQNASPYGWHVIKRVK